MLVHGAAEGPVLRSSAPINFLGGVDTGTGVVGERGHELFGRSVGGTILAFPSGAGSSVGAYTIYSLKARGSAPLAMVCGRADLTVATGCAMAGIPLVVSGEALASLETGQRAALDTRAAEPLRRA